MKSDLHELLNWIDPCVLEYDEWLSVGMAIKHEGGTADDWDVWSRRDHRRHKPGECYRKWDGFGGSATPVTAGTLVEMAKRFGYVAPRSEGHAYGWDDTIRADKDLRVIDSDWVEDRELHVPADWNPVQDVIRYLRTLFQAEEHVGYVCESWNDGERWLPKAGSWTRTAGQLIDELQRTQDIGLVLGDYNPEVGAWVRFNPLDGAGIKDINITAYRYALIESDTETIERQAAIYSELELPVAALVHSGKKSLHAIVRIDASTKEEYKSRVNFLHEVCRKNGLKIDTQNKNPSRLSRLPGVMRGGARQWLVGTNQGKASWDEWKAWIDEANDNLPDIEPLSSVFASLPPLAPALIDGVLREGHKLLLSGPSKAGKSYLLLQLAMATAEGREWLGWECRQGRVLYVNLELDRASCLHRLAALYQAKGWVPCNLQNIDIWNLRGRAVPMDALAPKLIRRAQKRGYKLVIIDPIYKVITGDENAADKMAFFCNQFDRLCTELGAAVVYCHHHSKGSQGQKNSRDRSSGSGVFARDPDAILDLLELRIDDERRKQIVANASKAATRDELDDSVPNWQELIDQDTAQHADKFVQAATALLNGRAAALHAALRETQAAASHVSGWLLEATLREFQPIKPRRIFFRYPIHVEDTGDLLLDATPEGEEAPWQRGPKRSAKPQRSNKQQLEAAWNNVRGFDEGAEVRVGDVADQLGVSEKRVKRMLAETSDYVLCQDGVIRAKAQAKRWELGQAIEGAKDLHGNVKLADVAKAMKACERTVTRRLGEMPEYEIRNGYIVAVGVAV